MSSDYLHVIDVADGDPVVVTKHSHTGGGLQFSQGGVVTTLPYSQVTRIRRVDVDDLRACAAGEEVSDEVQSIYDDLADQLGDFGGEPDSPAPDGPTPVPEGAPAADGPGDGTAPDVDPKTGAGQARETGGDPSAKDLRAWATDQGIAVPASGPVPDSVKAAYAAAHTD